MCAQSDTGFHLGDHLLQERRSLGAILFFCRFVPFRQTTRNRSRHDGTNRGRTEHLLRLALELRFGHAYRDHRGEAGKEVVLFWLIGSCLQFPRILLDLLPEEARKPLLESAEMRAPFRGRDDIHEALDLRVVSGSPAQGDIHVTAPLNLTGHERPADVVHDRYSLRECRTVRNPPGVGDRRVDREEVDELRKPTLVGKAMHGGRTTLIERLGPLILNRDR